MEIILFSGKAENGKTTTAIMVKTLLEAKGKKVLKIAYGDLVKYICGKYFNWDGKKDEKGRQVLQQIGTNVIRARNPNYWVDFVINFVKLFEDKYDYVVIDDSRFLNEIKRWDRGEWDTTTVRVTREGYVNSLTAEQKQHPSETDLDDYNFDYYITARNSSELSAQVNKFIKYLEEE